MLCLSKQRLTPSCAYGDCDGETCGIDIAGDGVWESRCEIHAAESCKRLKLRRRIKQERHLSDKLIDLSRGRKRRVIHKGEFPGQHLE